ncbi:pyruvate dehydrogenase complex dihydrolipoyllysine-residue acetyltransferase [Candidatus Doolittlea endobia]|uniref:Acetyltransferase component of pyruvate dehydrogenase complex n=1 Tax=Candidatus Doolittlea endobia TaxID=1778262 RepID=A0A143WSP0_9ENTR|nr:pyruvate dehydrogenase complex dihydrolipoyllysine-residue acetyltransferase [Candidatus Doolittlea endobia]CUX96547.1 Dihydrolipoyllysine-residue acetyltransferase component of pyruvate dehydrogenase complex [Candidatus Doolittlea endobia]
MDNEMNVPNICRDKIIEAPVSKGDKVKAEQSLITVEGDKASIQTSSRQALIMTTDSALTIQPVSTDGCATENKEIHVPDIGDDEVEVTEILVKVGDKVKAEQSLITIEGDKTSMEVPAPFSGMIKAVKVNIGDKVNTGSLIMICEEAASSTALPQSPSIQSIGNKKDVHVPDIGGNALEVTEVMVKVGDKVKSEQSLITVEGDKTSMEVPAPFDGTVKEININVGDKISTGSKMMVFEAESTATVAPTITSNVKKNASTATFASLSPNGKNEFAENDAYIHATPVIRRLAREFGVNLEKVKGTGRKKRILREDIQAYIKDVIKRAETVPSVTGVSPLLGLLPWPKMDFSKLGDIETVDLSRIQKISGANLLRNWVTIPHVTQFDEADITEMEAFRKQQNTEAEKKKRNVKITPLVFIMKAVAKGLEEFPRFNSSLSEDAQKLTLKKYINIGVAVDTSNGLVVPVFRDVHKKGILELSHELTAISQKARDGKLTALDMQGGCFTISSLGGIGGTAFTPIVNAPEVAILGVSKSSTKPIWNGTEFSPRLMLPLSLSYDHRVIDGADSARFIRCINNMLSDIRLLMM